MVNLRSTPQLIQNVLHMGIGKMLRENSEHSVQGAYIDKLVLLLAEGFNLTRPPYPKITSYIPPDGTRRDTVVIKDCYGPSMFNFSKGSYVTGESNKYS